MSLQELKKELFAALAAYEYEESKRDDKTHELADTCAALMVKKADLEDKIKELTDVIAKLSVLKDVKDEKPSHILPEKRVIHG